MVKKLHFSTIEERNRYIVSKKEDGVTNQKISEEVGIQERQIRNVAKAYKINKRLFRKTGSGRKNALSKGKKKAIVNSLRKNPYQSSQRLASRLNTNTSGKTVSRYLKKIDWTYKKAVKIPKLTQEHKEERVKWAKNHQGFDWENTIFTDECHISLGDCRYGWSKKGCPIQQESDCYPPRVQLWGAISTRGVISFTFYEGKLKHPDYIEILRDSFVEFAEQVMDEHWIFQQDGARPHTAKNTMVFLKDHVPEVLPWPANSPDLNPIENLWGVLRQKVYSRNPQDISDLEAYVVEEMSNISRDDCGNLVLSMDDRCKMIIENEGAAIPY